MFNLNYYTYIIYRSKYSFEHREKIQINSYPGVKIRYKINPHDEWKYVEIIGKAGKETAKNNNWYNVTDGYNRFSLNLEILNIVENVSGSNSNDFNLENDL